ncbi:MAG: branched-chain amino acid ABC transporter permease [Candidatus Bathyarchaeota archaeon]|nr:branched-chain amino acid ABC transporter permease [Candidatus Bathyarchaeum sp.]
MIDATILLWGVAIGSIYVLLATGLNLIFGVMKLVNFAHGELLMLGAYVSYSITTGLGLDVYLSIFVSMGVIALVGLGVERLAFRRVLGADKLNEIFVSLGLILIFDNVAVLIWGEDSKLLTSPFKGMGLHFGDVFLRYDLLIAFAVVVAILVGLLFLINKTKVGMAMRATSQKSQASMLMGINIEHIYIFTFMLGAVLAGAAGTLFGIIFPFNPYIGALPTIKTFAIIILGGLGSIKGAIVGGLLFGIAENLASATLGSIWGDAVAFALLIAVLILRPKGLFGEKGD